MERHCVDVQTYNTVSYPTGLSLDMKGCICHFTPYHIQGDDVFHVMLKNCSSYFIKNWAVNAVCILNAVKANNSNCLLKKYAVTAVCLFYTYNTN